MSSPPPPQPSTPLVACADLDATIAHYTQALGYRLDMIMPADAPRAALLSNAQGSIRLELDRGPPSPPPHDPTALILSRAADAEAWVAGRAGMQYRDLLPSRLGGRCIASHIRIPEGGPVADYVHYHHVEFQMIYCRRGWVRVVYQDQGPPFVLEPGDCVLQPPTIRHRVLEASDGLEVIEIALPAEHETWRDHELALPTATIKPERRFGGQRFVRHIAANAAWQPAEWPGFEYRDTGISDATDGRFSVRVLRASGATEAQAQAPAKTMEGQFSILCVLSGRLDMISQALATHTLAEGDACAIPASAGIALAAMAPCEVLSVTAA